MTQTLGGEAGRWMAELRRRRGIMGTVIIAIIIVLAAWNAVRTVGRLNKHMKNWNCRGDCDSCETPCQARQIYHTAEPKQTKQKK